MSAHRYGPTSSMPAGFDHWLTTDPREDEYEEEPMDDDDTEAAIAHAEELEQLRAQDDANRAADKDSLDEWLDKLNRFLNQHERAA